MDEKIQSLIRKVERDPSDVNGLRALDAMFQRAGFYGENNWEVYLELIPTDNRKIWILVGPLHMIWSRGNEILIDGNGTMPIIYLDNEGNWRLSVDSAAFRFRMTEFIHEEELEWFGQARFRFRITNGPDESLYGRDPDVEVLYVDFRS